MLCFIDFAAILDVCRVVLRVGVKIIEAFDNARAMNLPVFFVLQESTSNEVFVMDNMHR